MNNKQLLEVIKSLKHEILDLLINQNMADDQAAQQTLSIINNTFSRLNLEIEDVIPEETLKSYFGGVDEATKALNAAGVKPVNGLAASISSSGKVASAFRNHVHLEAIAEITDNTMLDLKAAIRTARMNTNASIETALESVKSDLKKGIIHGDARKVTTQRVAESFAKEGMTSFVTVDGKKLPLDFYSEVVTRTNLKKANTNGAIARYKENGEDLVKISGNTPTCHACHSYRGVVFSLSGKDKRFPSAIDNLPPYHPQCQCSASVYVIDYKTDAEINTEVERAKTFNPTKDTRSKSQKAAYDKQQALNRKRNAEKKQYANYKAVLGDDAPKTLGGFRRSKASNSDKFVEMQAEYKRIMRVDVKK